MFENGKPTEDNIDTMPEDLFEDETPTAEGAEALKEQKATETEAETAPAAEGEGKDDGSEDGITVKYNGKDVFVPNADIAKHVQKGMNYDHIFTEHQEYSTILDSIAGENGMDRKTFLVHLQNQQKQNAKDSAVETLRAKYPEMGDDALSEMADLKILSDAAERQRQAEAESKAKEQEQISSWRRLFELYPDVKVESMPKEVFDKVENGMSPIEAYQDHRIESLSAQLNADKTNKTNRQKAVGSLASEHKEEDVDPFLAGLNGKW